LAVFGATLPVVSVSGEGRLATPPGRFTLATLNAAFAGRFRPFAAALSNHSGRPNYDIGCVGSGRQLTDSADLERAAPNTGPFVAHGDIGRS